MPRVRIGSTPSNHETIAVEIARLRDLDVSELRSRWRAVWGRPAPPHLPGHLLFRLLAYRLQADHFSDLDTETKRLLDRSGSDEQAAQSALARSRQNTELRPGTILGREWDGRMHRVAVLAEGFAWNGQAYPSLSKVALAITGTRWNGPKFFGLRERQPEGSAS